MNIANLSFDLIRMDFLRELISFCARKHCTLDDLIYPDRGIPRSYEEALKWGRGYISLFDSDLENLISKYPMNNDQISRALTLSKWRNASSEIPPGFIAESESGNIIMKHQRNVRQMKRILEFFDERDNITSYSLESYSVTVLFSERISLDDLFDTINVPFALLGSKRKISTRLERNHFPNWFLSDSEDSKLLCRVEHFDIKITPDSLSFRCAKNGYKIASRLLSFLSIPEGDHKFLKNNIVCVGTLRISNPWKYYIFADVITNDPYVSEIASIIETSKPLHERKYMSFSCIGSRCTVSKQEKEIKTKISEVKGKIDSALVMSMISKIFEVYDKRYHEIHSDYIGLETSTIIREDPSPSKLSEIKKLRFEVPDLFIENYTREAIILPKIVKEEEMGTYKRVIQYPKENGKYYTSSDERYTVGLKLNRLKNKTKYPYIITCYTTDHMKREGTHTYRYYHEHEYNFKRKTRDLGNGQKAFLPLSLRGDFGLSKDYLRMGVKNGTFVQCVEEALGKHGIKDKIFKEVMKQELWNLDLEEEFSAGTDLCFRYFEEKYQCDIFIIESEGESHTLGPPRKVAQPYFWKKTYNRSIMILKNKSCLYHESRVSYELIVKGSKKIFDNDDLLSSLISKAKSKECFHFEDLDHTAIAQHINERGKCGLIKMRNGDIIRCSSRPLNLPEENLSRSKIEDAFVSTNKLMRQAGMSERKWRSTSNRDLFFPDKASFEGLLDKGWP
jgi:hypothetical protein